MSEHVDEFAEKQANADTLPPETQTGVGNNPLPGQGGDGPVDDVRDPEGDSGSPQTGAEHAANAENAGSAEEDE
jgi:hypothetical protein